MFMTKRLLKTKRYIFILGCCACMMFSTVSFAQSRYVGNLPTQSAVHAGITVRGNASYLYRVTRDEISCYATLSGRDSDETISSGPFNGVKMFGNKKWSVYR